MRRNTAGINFRVNHASVALPAEQVLDEITEDNTVLREETTIREKFFDVVLEEQLFDMREDTSLVIVDIPGLNEAGSRDMYLKYVRESWDTFDCVIVVMDASRGVNSEEQVNLLRFVKENMAEQNQVPIIVLCNKVDDPDDAEVVELVNEVEEKVAKMFPGYAASNKNQKEGTADAGIAFIPISAGNAYMYRSASRLPLQQFKRPDKGCIDKIGHEECGKFKWKRLSREEQYELVYGVVNDPAQFEERLKACNFDTFLGTLEKFLGGKGVQEDLITKQLELMLSKLSHDKGFTDKLCSIYDRSAALGREVIGCYTFWKLYDDAEKDSINEFENDPTKITHLAKLMDELSKYSMFLHAKLFGAEGDATARKRDGAMILEAMKRLIKHLCGVLVQKEASWDFDKYFSRRCFTGFSLGSVSKEHKSPTPSFSTTKAPSRSTTAKPFSTSAPVSSTPTFTTFPSWENKSPTPSISTAKAPSAPSRSTAAKAYSTSAPINSTPTSATYPPFPSFSGTVPVRPLLSWDQLSPYDWHNVLSSILLMKHRQHFCEHFGTQIAQLEWLGKTGKFNLTLNEIDYCPSHQQYRNECGCTSNNKTSRLAAEYRTYLRGNSINGEFVPVDKEKYKRAAQIVVPGSPQDVQHWGHVIWKFCQHVDSLKQENIYGAET